MVRRALSVAILILASTLSWFVAASPASAVCSNSGTHCYGVFDWNDQPIAAEGTSADVLPSCLSVPTSGVNFANNEMWLGDAGLAHWVEVGWITTHGFPGLPDNTNYGFWAQKRPGDTGVSFINLDSITPPSRVHLAIYRADASTFWVKFGSSTTTSRGNSMVVHAAAIGSEVTTAKAHSRGSFIGLNWFDSSVWHPQWTSGNYGSLVVNAPNTFAWSTPGSATWAGVPC